METGAVPKRVLLIAKGFPPDLGGIETYSREVAVAYARLGHSVHVLTSHVDHAAENVDEFAWFKSVIQRSQPETAARMQVALFRLRMNGYVPDLIHATSWRVAGPAKLLWPSARLVITVHGNEVFTVSSAMRRLAKGVLSMSDKLVFVSDAIRRKFNAAYPGFETRGLVAWNGCTKYPSDSRAPIREKDAIFTVCRLVERKNICLAVRAAALLRDRGRQFHYRIAGRGPEAERLAMLIAELQLQDHVELLGFVPGRFIAAEYSRAAIFLHPQIEAGGGADIEGFGIAIADAMQFGAVPVAGDNGGPSEFLRNGVNGLLVDARRVEEIADALEHMLTSPSELERIGENARDFASRHFLWTTHVSTIIES